MNEYLLFGFLGGLLPDVIRFVKNYTNPNLPEFYESWVFYLGLLFLIGLGGLSAFLFEANSIKEAIAFGYGAPQLISSLAGKKVNEEADRTRGGGNGLLQLQRWWAI